jgi:hypothetical protein
VTILQLFVAVFVDGGMKYGCSVLVAVGGRYSVGSQRLWIDE